MAMTVHLPSSLSGDLKIPSVDRYNQPPETRKLQRFGTESRSTIPNQTKIQNQAEIRARVELATKTSSNLAHRLHILRHRLDFLKYKLGSTFANVYRDPPDPGPTRSSELKQFMKNKRILRSRCRARRWIYRYVQAVISGKRSITRFRKNS
ncbi:hypothetical protein PVAP13_9KG374200 [Panicum virgatum]|uniref:Uncharacterized protein n=1 Tax=Panicum virgatum TaxID=38727 RepID=A0A8T0NSB5_PANVG|nr:hypothetical protein PVAP13_9KG374200 [Panicum virgatum]